MYSFYRLGLFKRNITIKTEPNIKPGRYLDTIGEALPNTIIGDRNLAVPFTHNDKNGGEERPIKFKFGGLSASSKKGPRQQSQGEKSCSVYEPFKG